MQYQCERCHGVFDYDPATDVDARAKMIARDGPLYLGERIAAVCYNCHNEFLGWYGSRTPEQIAEIEADRLRGAAPKGAA